MSVGEYVAEEKARLFGDMVSLAPGLGAPDAFAFELTRRHHARIL